MQTALADFIRDTAEGREADGILRACVHCGFCTATCPTYQLLGDELDLLDIGRRTGLSIAGIVRQNETAWRPPARIAPAGDRFRALVPYHAPSIAVEGIGLDNASQERVIAIASGGPFTLRGNENICLCIAPPETYVDDCASWQCVFDTGTGACQSPY